VPDRLEKDLPQSNFKVDMEKVYKDLVLRVNQDMENKVEKNSPPSKTTKDETNVNLQTEEELEDGEVI
jgi:hypothetical protein